MKGYIPRDEWNLISLNEIHIGGCVIVKQVGEWRYNSANPKPILIIYIDEAVITKS